MRKSDKMIAMWALGVGLWALARKMRQLLLGDSVLGRYGLSAKSTAFVLAVITCSNAFAEPPEYRIQPGDLLQVSVWREPDLQAEVLVRPDGGMSFALAGDLRAEGHSVQEVRDTIDQRLRKYIPDPVVTVSLKAIGGNHIYVLGKVNRPGEFPFSKPLDVMQALSLAGGTTPFASLNGIQILRRVDNKQTAIPFRYSDVEGGHRLDQNVLLQSGDTVVVP